MVEARELPRRPYVWHEPSWQQCLQLVREQRLPHALLLSGAAGIGKAAFAEALAQFVLCATPRGDEACGQCKSCLLQKAGSHPDLMRLEPETDAKTEKTSKVIKVDQVRELVGFAAKSAQMGGFRVVIVQPAHVLNVQAANALLKTLEEPGRDTLFLLLTDRPMELLPTIRSRCRQLPLSLPSPAQAGAWLEALVGGAANAQLLLALSRGAPLAALQLFSQGWFSEREALAKDLLAVLEGRQSALGVAGRWQKAGAEAMLAASGSLLEDANLCALGQGGAVKSQDLLPIIQRIAGLLGSPALLRVLAGLAEKQRLLQANIQAAAIVDSFWLEWNQAVARRA